MFDWIPAAVSYVVPTKSASEYAIQADEVQCLQQPQTSLASQGPEAHRHGKQETVKKGMGNDSVDVPSVEFTDSDCIERNTNSRHRSTSDRKSLKAYEHDKANMVKDLQQMTKKLHDAELRNRELSSMIQYEFNESRRRITALETELGDKQSQFTAVIGQLQSAERRSRELEEGNRRQWEQLQVVKDELRRAEAQHAQTRHLLEERTTELKGAQRFLTQTDFLSGAEVIAIAESLNAEILQAAAFMADSLEFSPGTTKENITAYEVSYERARRVLGEPMMKALRSRWEQHSTDLDPTPVQIALQIYMVYCSVKMADLWIQGGKGKENEVLADIFSRLYEQEEQAVSGRWRSMTRAHARARDTPDFATNYIVDGLVHVLTIAGWVQDNKKTALINMFQGRVSMIVDLTIRLRKGTGEDITSATINLKRFHSGEKFDSRVMDDTYADDRRNGEQMGSVFSPRLVSSGERVAGTTEIGLVRVVKGRQPEELLKPKVVLCSAL